MSFKTKKELTQGSRNDKEWQRLNEYLDGQDHIEMQSTTWRDTARIYFDLRKNGITVRSSIDCCIA